MTFSPLISGTVPHHNKFSSRGGRPITRLIQHHWAGVGGGIERMSDPNQQASCTYIITTDGRILGHVPEEYRPWTSGSAEADAPSITIEVQNTGGQVNRNDSDPASWPISDAAYNAIIRLLVDVAQRHGWAAIDASTYVGHRQFYSTACPGGYLWSRMDQTRQLAQQAFTGSLSYASESITPVTEDEDMTSDQFNNLVAKLDELNAAHHVATREHINGKIPDIAKASARETMSHPVRYRNPETGAETDQTTTLGTVVAFRDFNDVQNRLASASPKEIARLVPEAFVAEVVKLLTERLSA